MTIALCPDRGKKAWELSETGTFKTIMSPDKIVAPFPKTIVSVSCEDHPHEGKAPSTKDDAISLEHGREGVLVGWSKTRSISPNPLENCADNSLGAL